MNKLQEWRRKMELKHKKAFTAEDLAKLLNISLSYYSKISAGFEPVTKNISNKLKKALTE